MWITGGRSWSYSHSEVTEQTESWKEQGWDFPCGPMIGNPSWNAEDVGSTPACRSRLPWAMGQVSPSVASTEPACSGARRPSSPEPTRMHAPFLERPCTPARILPAATKSRHSQINKYIFKKKEEEEEERKNRNSKYAISVRARVPCRSDSKALVSRVYLIPNLMTLKWEEGHAFSFHHFSVTLNSYDMTLVF